MEAEAMEDHMKTVMKEQLSDTYKKKGSENKWMEMKVSVRKLKVMDAEKALIEVCEVCGKGYDCECEECPTAIKEDTDDSDDEM